MKMLMLFPSCKIKTLNERFRQLLNRNYHNDYLTPYVPLIDLLCSFTFFSSKITATQNIQILIQGKH